MSQRMAQVKGIDTVVDQFRPSRSNPVARRAIRKYYAQQPVTGTSTFENLSFQVEQTDPKNVINEIRMVFPLELKAYTVAENGDPVPIEMHTNSWKRSNNIAVAQNAPFSAFRNLEVAINGKIYSQQFQRYGKTLGQCFQSYSEMSFQNDESLKPIANNFMGRGGDFTRHIMYDEDGDATGNFVHITDFKVEPSSFSLLENNSGFIARARRFQDGLTADGETWRGEISSLFHSSIFNAEARRQGNDQIPYVSDLYVNCVFETNPDILDKKFSVDSIANLQGYQRTVPQNLFEFLTPMTAAFPHEQRVPPTHSYPWYFALKWTGQPYLSIEWVTYSQSLLSPMYKLRGLRYQHEETLPFQVQYEHAPEDRNWVSTSIRRQLLAVPNLIYVWVEPTLATVRNSFCWGGMFRTLDLRNFRCRVNGSVDIIQDPSEEILFKWYKRNTSNVFEFPTWCKNKVICFSPSEVGLKDWLENQASVSTIDISLETSYSKLMIPEYKRLSEFNDMNDLGYQPVVRPHSKYPDKLNDQDYQQGYPNRVQLLDISAAGFTPLSERDTNFWLYADGRLNADTYLTEHSGSYYRVDPDWWMKNVFDKTTWRADQNLLGEFSVDRINKPLLQWSDGFTYWMIVNPLTKDFQEDGNDGSVPIWCTHRTHIFQPIFETLHIHSVPWHHLYNNNFMENNLFSKEQLTTDWVAAGNQSNASDLDDLWGQIETSINSLRCVTYPIHANNEELRDTLGREKSFYVNFVDASYTRLDDKVRFLERNHSEKKWTISRYVMNWKNTLDSTWIYPDHRSKSVDAQDGQPKSFITQQEAAMGWRWVKLAAPRSARMTESDNPFYGRDAEDDPIDTVSYPLAQTYMETQVTRNRMNTTASPFTFHDTQGLTSEGAKRGLQLTQIDAVGDGDEDKIFDEPKFSLNMLLEYNNETVLMSQDRGKPVHLSNLIAPGLPRQD